MFEIVPKNNKLLTRLKRELAKNDCLFLNIPTQGKYVILVGLDEFIRKRVTIEQK